MQSLLYYSVFKTIKVTFHKNQPLHFSYQTSVRYVLFYKQKNIGWSRHMAVFERYKCTSVSTVMFFLVTYTLVLPKLLGFSLSKCFQKTLLFACWKTSRSKVFVWFLSWILMVCKFQKIKEVVTFEKIETIFLQKRQQNLSHLCLKRKTVTNGEISRAILFFSVLYNENCHGRVKHESVIG